jgi:hypothetical protein
MEYLLNEKTIYFIMVLLEMLHSLTALVNNSGNTINIHAGGRG